MNNKIKTIGIAIGTLLLLGGVFLLSAESQSERWRAFEQDRQFTGLADPTKMSDYQVQSWVVFTKMNPADNNPANNFKSVKFRYYLNTSAPLTTIRDNVIWQIGNYAYSNNIPLNTKDVIVPSYDKSNVQYSYP